MHLPDRLGGRQHQPVEHRTTGRQNAGDGVGALTVGMPAAGQAVRAGKRVADLEPALLRHAGAKHRLHRRRPHRPLRQGRAVVADVIGRAADNPEPTKTVAHADGNDFRHLRMQLQRLHGGQRNVAGGNIELQHAGQNKLHRATLGADDRIDARQVALECGVDLVADQQQE